MLSNMIGVEDFEPFCRIFESIQAKAPFQTLVETTGQHKAAEPVDNDNKIHMLD